ncbi:unnamed protein product [Phytophthora fragariaefolia]|uniref:Unnamed protein product n=1 Tax=Phytophthora fragariaefolia TaxID=1490495 RepID=A0A9W6WW90_9STRA|nr:unnamed protein product [Phytophthora fragariaefolia]
MSRVREATDSTASVIGRRPPRSRALALPYPERRRAIVDEGSTTPEGRRTSSESLQCSPSVLDTESMQGGDMELADCTVKSPRSSTPESPDGLAPLIHLPLRVLPSRGTTVMPSAPDQVENVQPSEAAESSAPTLQLSTSSDGLVVQAHSLSPLPPPRGIAVMTSNEVQVKSVQPSQAMGPCVQEKRFQLLVRPIVKNTIGQRDSSGNTLDDFVATGDSFSEIIHRLWNAFSHHVIRRAIKHGDGWWEEAPDESAWAKVMQLKLNKHLVDNTKSDEA